MRFVPFVLALVVLGATAAGAGAAPARTADLCSAGKGVATMMTKAGSFTPSATASPQAIGQQLKATYTRLMAAEKIVLAAASGSIKGHLQKVFAVDNLIYAKLKAANWNVLVFAKNAQFLEAQLAKIRPDLLAIQAYFAKCK